MKKATLTFRDSNDNVISKKTIKPRMTMGEILETRPSESVSFDIEFKDEKYFDRFAFEFEPISYSIDSTLFLRLSMSYFYHFAIDEFLGCNYSKEQKQSIAKLVGQELSKLDKNIMTIFDSSDIGIFTAFDDQPTSTKTHKNLFAGFFIDEEFSMLSVIVPSFINVNREQIKNHTSLTGERIQKNISEMNSIIEKIVANVKDSLALEEKMYQHLLAS